MSISIKKTSAIYYSYALTCEIIYILFYYCFFDLRVDTLIYAIIHGVFSTGFLIWAINNLEKIIIKKGINLIYIINFIFAIYFQLSSVKYCYNHYVGFVESNIKRLLFNISVILLIYFITIFINKILRVDRFRFNINGIKNILKIKSIYLFLITMIYIVLSLAMLNYNFMDNIVIQILIIEFFTCFLIVINCANIDKKISIANLILLLMLFIYRSIISGKRNEIMVPLMIILVVMLFFGQIKLKIIKKIIPFAGIGYVVLSLILFKTSSRFELNSDYMKSYLGNRFDVTDFALTNFQFSKSYKINNNLLKDSMINSIPEVFLNNKEEYYKNEYNALNARIGLDPNIDYGDTIISTATQIWPGYGAIVILIIFYAIINIISILCFKLDILGALIILFNLNFILNVEMTTDAFFSGIRNLIVVSVLAYLIYFILRINNRFKIVIK